MKIQIRSPSLNQALEIGLEFSSTVWNLKEEIQKAHPQHPLPSSQRIIFSGKLLNNDDPLDVLLNKLGDSVVPIFHLVVKPSLLGPRQTPSSVTTTTMPSSAVNSNQTTQTPINNPVFSTTTTSAPISSIQANHAFTNTALYPPVLPGGYQLVALNGQYYLAPVLVLAINNTQQGIPTSMQAPSSTTTNYIQTDNNNHFHYTQNQQQQPQAQQQQQQAGAADQPILVRPVNVQRAASIWLALKLYFIVFLLCQGASLERILLLHAIALVMFMYQTGRLRVVVRRMRVVRMGPVIRDPPPNPPQQRQQQGEQNNNDLSEHSAPPPRSTTTGNSSSSRTSLEPTTRLEILKRGIYMFIASFWPNYGRDPRTAQVFENEERQA